MTAGRHAQPKNVSFRHVLAGILVCALLFSVLALLGVFDGSKSPIRTLPKAPIRTQYAFAADYDGKDMLNCKLEITYINTSKDTLSELYLYLHANATPGCADILSACINDASARFFLQDEGRILRIVLPDALKSRDVCVLTLDFTLTLPKTAERYGRTENTVQLGNFCPIMAVYDNGWQLMDSYITMGDPYYSEIADYKYALTYPEHLTLACTGEIVSQTHQSGQTTAIIAAPQVRDIACVLSNAPASAKTTFSDTVIHSHAGTQESADTACEIAKNALALYTELIGPYPYSTLYVVETSLPTDCGGMEYPGLVMISSLLYNQSDPSEFELTIAHEIAHQWFYAVVGNDQYNAPWLDEALVSYLGLVYFKESTASTSFEKMYARTAHATAGLQYPIDGTLSDYPNANAYGAAVYARGAAMFRALSEELGEEVFYRALKNYYTKNAFSTGTRQSLYAAFSDAAGQDLTAFFDRWLSKPDAA